MYNDELDLEIFILSKKNLFNGKAHFYNDNSDKKLLR